MPAIARNAEGEVQTSDCSDFEELKRQRKEKMRAKIIVCIRALRNCRAEDDGQIVDELMQDSI